jgi:UDP-N-acetylmuramoylalanine--D-glutamate ligase
MRPALPGGPYLVVGLARSGSAVALALRARGEEVLGVDSRPAAASRELLESGVGLLSEAQAMAALDGVRTVVKSPGVPSSAPLVAAALARGLTVVGELELGWRMVPNDLIAVTGTNGKTTTVEWIAHVHRLAGEPVAVAGNVGLALSHLAVDADGVPPGATVVCEASSFQLEDAIAFAPDVAVLLNISPDHLDRHGSLGAYRAAKLRIFAHQPEGATAVLWDQCDVDPAALGGRARELRFGEDTGDAVRLRDGQLWWHADADADRPEALALVAVEELALRGAHNVQNAMAVAAVCLARGIDVEALRAGLRQFAGVAHRLQEVARLDGVLYVNDSKATNVASTLVALRAFCPADAAAPGAVHLILGGQGKGQDFTGLRAPVQECCRAVYLIGEDGEVIAQALGTEGPTIHRCGELDRAVSAARGAAVAGEVVLLSPGCASFDQFADFQARGERFGELVLQVHPAGRDG